MPPFFLIGIAIVLAFLALTVVPALCLIWLGRSYPPLKINKPFRTLYSIAAVALVVRFITAIPQMAIMTKVRDVYIFAPPYLLCFFVVGFAFFSCRLEKEKYGSKEVTAAAILSGMCVIYYLLAQWAAEAYFSWNVVNK